MESRVYAEDPYRNFLPSIGKLTTYKPPYGEGVRVDEGVFEGGEISIYYDPLICKLVTHGATREESVARMRTALDAYVIRGVNHNIPFLRAVMENTRFLEGRLSTKFIPEEFPKGFTGFEYTPAQSRDAAALAAALRFATVQRDHAISDQVC
jgi:propionyl-CoA carboxylase alpha chain